VDHLPLQTGARNHLRGDPLIHQALDEVLEKTVGEWMTVGVENVMWVPEKTDVSNNSCTVSKSLYFMVVIVTRSTLHCAFSRHS
jgi:hypothetical protein